MTGDDHIALAGALVLAFLAIREARRYFRTLPDLQPDRVGILGLHPHDRRDVLRDAAGARGAAGVAALRYRVIHRWADHCDDSTGAGAVRYVLTRMPDAQRALFDALNAQGRALTAAFASTLAEIRSLPERETSA